MTSEEQNKTSLRVEEKTSGRWRPSRSISRSVNESHSGPEDSRSLRGSLRSDAGRGSDRASAWAGIAGAPDFEASEEGCVGDMVSRCWKSICSTPWPLIACEFRSRYQSGKTGRGQVPASRSEDSRHMEEGGWVQCVEGQARACRTSEAATPGDPLRRTACRACRWTSILDPGAKRQKGVAPVALSFPTFAILDDAEFDFFFAPKCLIPPRMPSHIVIRGKECL